MVIFNSYVKLPEGTQKKLHQFMIQEANCTAIPSWPAPMDLGPKIPAGFNPPICGKPPWMAHFMGIKKKTWTTKASFVDFPTLHEFWVPCVFIAGILCTYIYTLYRWYIIDINSTWYTAYSLHVPEEIVSRVLLWSLFVSLKPPCSLLHRSNVAMENT